MSSRKQALNKPYWKRASNQIPAYHRQYAFDDEGAPVLNEGHYVVKEADGTLTYDKSEQVYRDTPNRALKRKIYSQLKKEQK